MSSHQEKTRKLILDIYLKNPQKKVTQIARDTKTNTRTVYTVINKFKKGESIQRKKGSGRKAGPSDKNLLKNVRDKYSANPRLSSRDVATKTGTSQSTVMRYKKFAGLKTYKTQKVPDRSEDKQRVAKTRARKLYDRYLTKFDCLVMDDETYCKADFNQIPGNVYYTVKDKNKVSQQISTTRISKFPKQYMVWQAICKCGLRSQEFITTGTINSKVYIEECLQKRLLPFITQHQGSVLFWPDLATSHYASTTMQWYENNNINIVPKEANPPNCPELRPIERYWAKMKSTLKKTKRICKNDVQFKNRWKQAYTAVTDRSVQILMKRVNANVKNFCNR